MDHGKQATWGAAVLHGLEFFVMACLSACEEAITRPDPPSWVGMHPASRRLASSGLQRLRTKQEYLFTLAFLALSLQALRSCARNR